MKRTKKTGTLARVPKEFIEEAHSKGMSVKQYTLSLKQENELMRMLIGKKKKEEKFRI